jgi:hypothetical protein
VFCVCGERLDFDGTVWFRRQEIDGGRVMLVVACSEECLPAVWREWEYGAVKALANRKETREWFAAVQANAARGMGA